jgi:hypothetical protein
MALFAKSERNQSPKRQHAILCAFSTQGAPSANASRRRLCLSAALASMTFDGAHSSREFIGLLMTSGPDRRHQLKARADRAPGFAG